MYNTSDKCYPYGNRVYAFYRPSHSTVNFTLKRSPSVPNISQPSHQWATWVTLERINCVCLKTTAQTGQLRIHQLVVTLHCFFMEVNAFNKLFFTSSWYQWLQNPFVKLPTKQNTASCITHEYNKHLCKHSFLWQNYGQCYCFYVWM